MKLAPEIEAAENLRTELRPPTQREINALRRKRDAALIALYEEQVPWTMIAKAAELPTKEAWYQATWRAYKRIRRADGS